MSLVSDQSGLIAAPALLKSPSLVMAGGLRKVGEEDIDDGMSYALLNAAGSDRLIRPVGDTTIEHLIAPSGRRYDIQPT
jgi:hypothetical protein